MKQIKKLSLCCAAALALVTDAARAAAAAAPAAAPAAVPAAVPAPAVAGPRETIGIKAMGAQVDPHLVFAGSHTLSVDALTALARTAWDANPPILTEGEEPAEAREDALASIASDWAPTAHLVGLTPDVTITPDFQISIAGGPAQDMAPADKAWWSSEGNRHMVGEAFAKDPRDWYPWFSYRPDTLGLAVLGLTNPGLNGGETPSQALDQCRAYASVHADEVDPDGEQQAIRTMLNDLGGGLKMTRNPSKSIPSLTHAEKWRSVPLDPAASGAVASAIITINSLCCEGPEPVKKALAKAFGHEFGRQLRAKDGGAGVTRLLNPVLNGYWGRGNASVAPIPPLDLDGGKIRGTDVLGAHVEALVAAVLDHLTLADQADSGGRTNQLIDVLSKLVKPIQSVIGSANVLGENPRNSGTKLLRVNADQTAALAPGADWLTA